MPVLDTSAATGYTLQSMVDDCRDTFLYTGDSAILNRLATDVTAAQTSFTFSQPIGNLGVAGCRFAIDYEEMRAWANDGNLVVSTVERGVGSSTAAVHGAGTMVEVAPKFSQYRVKRAINEELDALSAAGLFQVGELELTYNPAVQGYDLGAITFDGVIDLRFKLPGPSKDWPLLRSYAVLRNADTTQFPSGNGIIVYEAGYPGLPIRVRYRGPFSHLNNPSDDVGATSGLQSQAQDLVVLGAAIRLTVGGEIQRNFLRAQRDPALLEGIPPGAIGNSPKNLMLLYQVRLQQEQERLMRLYPRVVPR